MFVAKNAMLFFLYCLVFVTSVFPEGHIDSENVMVVAEDEAGGRISGGVVPDRGARAAPFQAQITREGANFCSGTIINEQYILTAAHCVEGAKPQELTVRVGTNVRGEGMVVPIEKIVQHPDYDYPQNNFDIAYMRTVEDIPLLPIFVTSLRAAFIDSPNASVPNELHVTGWGYQEDNQRKLADKIRAVDLPVISNAECQVFYPMMSITKNMICGYSLRDMEKGTCVGDGGDPATVGLRLVGVSSAARGCGPGMGPSVFTYVDAKEIRNFILNGTSQNGSQRPGNSTGRPQRPSKRPEKHPHERPSEGDPNYTDYIGETTEFPTGDPNYPDYIGETTKFPADYSDYDKERPGGTSQRPAGDPNYPDYIVETTEFPTGDPNYPDYIGETTKFPADYSDYDKERPGGTSQRLAGDPNYPDYIGETTEFPTGDPNYPDYIGETTKFPADYSDYDKERPGSTSQRPAGDPNYPDYIGETTEIPAGDPNYPDYIGETTKFPANYSDYDQERPTKEEDVSQRPQRKPADRPQKRPAEREP